MNFLPSKLIIKDYVRYILSEDITYNDITTELVVESKDVEAVINFRESGIVCGIPFVEEIYRQLDEKIILEVLQPEQKYVKAGTDVIKVKGDAKSILTGERTALNVLQKASGIATTTNQFVKEVEGSQTKITDTRKTTPGARLLEKYSIRIGGAFPHRYNLSDSVLIKDNHIAFAGSITEAIRRVKTYASHTVKIEVETETEQEVKEALEAGVDIIMLDNMSVKQMSDMVKLINGRAITEASGNVNLENIKNIIATNIDFISTSAITIKARVLDIGMDIK